MRAVYGLQCTCVSSLVLLSSVVYRDKNDGDGFDHRVYLVEVIRTRYCTKLEPRSLVASGGWYPYR